jgi:FlaG/FlaF family flagellin (archaellin)
VLGVTSSEVPMNDNAPSSIPVLVAVAIMAILAAVVYLQSLGKTTIAGDSDLPPLASGRQ